MLEIKTYCNFRKEYLSMNELEAKSYWLELMGVNASDHIMTN